MTAQILVVDDEPDLERSIQQKFRRQIRDGSVSFLFASDGVEALAQLKRTRHRHGGQRHQHAANGRPVACAETARGRGQLSTIIVSAYGDMTNIRTAMNRGAFDFLTKPIDFPDLEATIAKTIRHIKSCVRRGERQAAAERAHASLSRYFSPNLAERLASDAAAVDLARAEARDRGAVHRHCRLYLAGRNARTGRAGVAQRLSRWHDRRRFRP